MKQVVEVTLNKAQLADIKKSIKQSQLATESRIKDIHRDLDRINGRLNDVINLITPSDSYDADYPEESE